MKPAIKILLGKDIILPQYNDSPELNIAKIKAYFKAHCRITETLKTGTLLCFLLGGKPHLGIMVNRTKFFHCDKAGCRLSNIRAYRQFLILAGDLI
jgi:hypothetical protein